jgi:hypothetical protein|tara:strand:+ start:62 stop:484 length:423 start_codon:yes stop_codon:yes gene_type:complete
MKKTELKKLLKPLIKECIKEVIFEDGTLSGIISEVAKGLGNVNTSQTIVEASSKPKQDFKRVRKNLGAGNEMKKHLEESRKKLESSTGLKGIFEGTQPMHQSRKSENSQYSSLRDRDPNDAGVDITGILSVAGNAWDQLK